MIMASSFKSLASKYSKHYLNKLTGTLLAKNNITPDPTPEQSISTDLFEFEMDLEVTYNSENKVKDIVIR